MNPVVRVGIPLTGGQLVNAARERGYPVLFSANAFAKTYGAANPKSGDFKGFRMPDPEQFRGLDAALDSAGFVAAVHYGDYRWTIENYLDLVEAHPWTWWASMDYCCEPQVAKDRPLRLLRIAATANMLGRCRRLAQARGLSMPMPVLQGWTAEEYVMSAELLPIPEWPDLIGIGSVCRRNVHGPDGILAILEALDPVLPPHVKVHLFGVKSQALAKLIDHPRLMSVDSMAWDVAARNERRTGRDMAYRIGHMETWAEKQLAIAQTRGGDAAETTQQSLFPPEQFSRREFSSEAELALEALALQYCDLLLSGDLEYLDAVWQAKIDAATVVAIVDDEGLSAGALERLDEVFGGLAQRVADMRDDCPSMNHCRAEADLVDLAASWPNQAAQEGSAQRLAQDVVQCVAPDSEREAEPGISHEGERSQRMAQHA